jgi:Asp-tRNA(Asn)/Glu-tRNA(Gln) amidotransferase A subunit family amidase
MLCQWGIRVQILPVSCKSVSRSLFLQLIYRLFAGAVHFCREWTATFYQDLGRERRFDLSVSGQTGRVSRLIRTLRVPLSTTLDCVGPIARDVETLRGVYKVLATQNRQDPAPLRHLIVPENFGMDDLEDAVADAFEGTIADLETCGFIVERRNIDFINTYKTLPIWHFSAVESRVQHAIEYAQEPSQIDPKVRSRMKRADTATAVEYASSIALRSVRPHVFCRAV